jgi:O-antigen/teichoic acid export membrane protein
MSNIRSSILFSFATKYLSLLLSLLATVVLSRLLTPSDTGVYSVAAVWAGIAQVFRDLGVSQYIIQEKQLTNDKIRAVYSVSFASSWTLALIILLSAAPAARFYHDPRLFDVLAVLAINFLLLPFGSVTMAYMSRELRFRQTSIVHLCSSVVSVSVSIGLALAGFGVMSLAWATPAGTLTTILLLAFYRPSSLPWLPGTRELRSVLSYVGFASWASITDEVGVAAPDIIIGKQLGMHSVGIYSKALGTVRIFHSTVSNILNPIILPYLSDNFAQGSRS